MTEVAGIFGESVTEIKCNYKPRVCLLRSLVRSLLLWIRINNLVAVSDNPAF